MTRKWLTKKDKSFEIEVKIALSFWERFCGLMGKKPITDADTIIFPNCNSVHTFFMRESIDVIFVRSDGFVLQIIRSLKPWRLLWPLGKAAHCIEMTENRSEKLGLSEGQTLVCEGVFSEI